MVHPYSTVYSSTAAVLEKMKHGRKISIDIHTWLRSRSSVGGMVSLVSRLVTMAATTTLATARRTTKKRPATNHHINYTPLQLGCSPRRDSYRPIELFLTRKNR